jgi:Tol biopolymer transport system component
MTARLSSLLVCCACASACVPFFDVPALSSDAGDASGPRFDDDAGIESDAGHDAGFDAGQGGGFDAGQDAGFDAGQDGGFDAGQDAGFDAGQDGGFDAGHDGGFDAGHDGGFDAGHDGGFDAGHDAGFDAGQDGGFDAGAGGVSGLTIDELSIEERLVSWPAAPAADRYLVERALDDGQDPWTTVYDGGELSFTDATFDQLEDLLYRLSVCVGVSCTEGDVVAVPAAAVRLSGANPVADARVEDLRLTPDGSRLLFHGNHKDFDELELFSVPTSGGEPFSLQGNLGPGRDVRTIVDFDDDASHVVFVGDIIAAVRNYVFSVPVDGSSGPVNLSDLSPDYMDVDPFPVFLNADKTRVIFRASIESDAANMLWSSPIDGSAPPTRLSPAGASIGLMKLAPASDRVVFGAALDDPFRGELYSVPADGSAAHVRLTPSNDPDRGVFGSWFVHDDGQRVVLVGDLDEHDRYDVFVVPADGSAAPLNLTNIAVAGGSVDKLYGPSADGAQVGLRGDLLTDGVDEVFTLALDGSSGPVRVSNPLGPSESAGFSIRFTPDSSTAVFTLNDADGLQQLFAAPVDGSAAAVQIAAPAVGEQMSTASLYLLPDSTRAIVPFTSPDNVQESYELYVAQLDGTGPPKRLSDRALMPDVGGSTRPLLFDATRGRFVYFWKPIGTSLFPQPEEVYLASVDGSTPPAPYHLGRTSMDYLSWHRSRLSEDGRALYLVGALAGSATFEIFRVRLVPSRWE